MSYMMITLTTKLNSNNTKTICDKSTKNNNMKIINYILLMFLIIKTITCPILQLLMSYIII